MTRLQWTRRFSGQVIVSDLSEVRISDLTCLPLFFLYFFWERNGFRYSSFCLHFCVLRSGSRLFLPESHHETRLALKSGHSF